MYLQMQMQVIILFMNKKKMTSDFIYFELGFYTETLELSEPNRIKNEFAGLDLFQYFDVFSSSVRFDIPGKF